MTRPRKNKVDYFPHSTNHGRTIFILEERFKNNGYAFWFKLLEILASTENHFIDLNDDAVFEFLCSKTRCDEKLAIEILNLLSKLSAIDGELWESRVIWCQHLVDGVTDVYTRSRHTLPPSRPDNYASKPHVNDISTQFNPQSKVKESKVKESKVKERKELPLGVYSADFEMFWKAYPRKAKKDKAWEAWKKRNGKLPPIMTIIESIDKQKHSTQWIKDGGQYIPHPATWINAAEWLNEEETHPLSGKVLDKTIKTIEMLNEWRPPQ